jgi:hypothetical protein
MEEETAFFTISLRPAIRFGDAVWVALRHGSFLVSGDVQALPHSSKAGERSL